MTMDERLQALTMNLELISIASDKNFSQIQQLIKISRQDGEHIRALARLAKDASEQIMGLIRIAEGHEQRLANLEGLL